MTVKQWITSLLMAWLLMSPVRLAIADEENTDQRLQVGFDYTSFRGTKDNVYFEMYFSIFMNNLMYVESDDRYKAEFEIDASLLDGDSVVAQRKWRNTNYIDSLKQREANQKLFSVSSMQAMPGTYQLSLVFTDLNSGNTVNSKIPVELVSISRDSLVMSELQLASDIKRTDKVTQYYKNGYQIIPNTERLYGMGLPMLMFYFELYNLKQSGEPDTAHYDVTYSILNSDREAVRKFPTRRKRKPGDSAVEVGGVNIITLISGTYFLNIDVFDTYSKQHASRDAKFYVYRPGDYKKTVTDSMNEEMAARYRMKMLEGAYQAMSEAEIDDEFAASTYIASHDEKKIYSKLDLSGKRQFMVQFWAQRDKTPLTPKNEFRDDYLMRVRTANKEFSSAFKKGYKTDEGRVLLIYGVPDEIERFPSSTDNRAYRIWRYFSIQGGVEFIFVDRRDYGEYQLVHSNARGEIYDSEWTRWIDPNQ